jgi:hypothetical protein
VEVVAAEAVTPLVPKFSQIQSVALTMTKRDVPEGSAALEEATPAVRF